MTGPRPLAPADFIAPGATLGVVGGGQLGRMFVQAAQRCGYLTAVLDADPTSPAGGVAQQHVRSGYLDAGGLAELSESCAAITTEFENVPAAALRALAAGRRVAPSADSVAICQDRAAEKRHFASSDVPCAPHVLIDSAQQLGQVDDAFFPGILKTTRLGYDGKGQVHVASRDELAGAWTALQHAPSVLEKRLPLAFEISVIVARNAVGERVHLPVQQNLHRDGVLAVTQVPAPDLAPALQRQAVDAAMRLATAMDYIGVLCVEFFVVDDGGPAGTLIANEMAPRPHNSGHYSVDACDLSQFDLQLRCLTGAPLAMPRLHSPAVMLNLLGDLWLRGGETPAEPPWREVLALPGAQLHLYGKAEPRRGRKMGHLTVTAERSATARAVALQAAALLGLPAF